MPQALALFILIALAVPSLADYCPPGSPQSSGMRHIMLIYLGGDRWTEEDFLPYVAHLDKDKGGAPDDWFYDSWLFLQFTAEPSGGSLAFGTANKADWETYFEALFRKDRSLAALDACIDRVGEQLGQTDQTCPIILMIPHLSHSMRDFGSLEGVPVDCSRDEDRLRAFRWAADQLLERWNAQTYKHLKLWGFYWMDEGISERNATVARGTGDYVRKLGYGLHWIPYFRAPGHTAPQDLGIDFTIMQPNYAFRPTPPGAVVPDQDRLSHNAYLCRKYGLGFEMETAQGPAAHPGRRLNLQLYMNHGVDELDGYMNGAVCAYYQGSDCIAGLYHSDNPVANRVYDDLHRFARGTYERRVLSLCEGLPAHLNKLRCPLLTDGVWLTQGERPERVATALSPATLDIDLCGPQIVGDVRVHVVAAAKGEPSVPVQATLLTSRDGESYDVVAEVQVENLREMGEWQGGFVLLTCRPHVANRLRIVISGGGRSVGVDEVIAYPAPHLLWEQAYEITGQVTAGIRQETGVELTDGRLYPGSSGVSFWRGEGTVSFALDDGWYLGSAIAHASFDEGDAPPQCRVRLTGPQTVETDWFSPDPTADGWIEIPLPRLVASKMEFELKGAPNVLWDELQVRRADNLASGKPYTIEPPFTSQYPDDGGELTDGVLSEVGFSDGKTVGWHGQAPSVVLDLGEQRAIEALRIHAEGGGHAGVYYPDVIRAWVSEDGQKWQVVMVGEPEREVTYSQDTDNGLNELAWLTVPVEGGRGRFVKLLFKGIGWLMLSELEVMSGRRNVAQGCSYHLQPAPKSEEKYADDGSRLTDGDYSARGEGWKKAVGWIEEDRAATLDLLQPAEVATVRLHCLGGGQAGIAYPRTVAVATSLDGETWTEETVVSPQFEQPGNVLIPAFITMELEPRQARYVRCKPTRAGWCMVDEVEVYGR